MEKSLFQHRHYKAIADIIQNMDDDVRGRVVEHFAINLRSSNPRFDEDHFIHTAMGLPNNNKDRVR